MIYKIFVYIAKKKITTSCKSYSLSYRNRKEYGGD